MKIENEKLKAASYCGNENGCQNEHTNCRPEFISGSKMEEVLKGKPVGYARQKAFTLAEILIAITIIGIISAITIPVLMQNTQKQEYVTALKKAYSTLSRVTNQIIAEEGSPKGDDGWALSNITIYNQLKKHLNVIKDCGTSIGCLDQLGTTNKYGFKHLSGKGYSSNYNTNTSWARMVLADGMQIMINGADKNCSGGSDSAAACGAVWVDINGVKKPNQYGRDFFLFELTPDGLYPYGCHESYTAQDDCNKNGTGHFCACKVIRENAVNY